MNSAIISIGSMIAFLGGSWLAAKRSDGWLWGFLVFGGALLMVVGAWQSQKHAKIARLAEPCDSNSSDLEAECL